MPVSVTRRVPSPAGGDVVEEADGLFGVAGDLLAGLGVQGDDEARVGDVDDAVGDGDALGGGETLGPALVEDGAVLGVARDVAEVARRRHGRVGLENVVGEVADEVVPGLRVVDDALGGVQAVGEEELRALGGEAAGGGVRAAVAPELALGVAEAAAGGGATAVDLVAVDALAGEVGLADRAAVFGALGRSGLDGAGTQRGGQEETGNQSPESANHRCGLSTHSVSVQDESAVRQ